MTFLERMKHDNGGDLPAFAWPGGYPIVYLASDGGEFCAACANGRNGSLARLADGPDDAPRDGWRLDAYTVHYEGADAVCAHCGKHVPSAYGDPEAGEVTP